MADDHGVHMAHCGPLNDGVCKYGDDDCPALTRVSTPPPAGEARIRLPDSRRAWLGVKHPIDGIGPGLVKQCMANYEADLLERIEELMSAKVGTPQGDELQVLAEELAAHEAEQLGDWGTPPPAGDDLVEAVARSAYDELRDAVKLAQMALQTFGDTEEGVSTAYTTLQLALKQTQARAALEAVRSTREGEIERLTALLRRVEPHLDAIICYASTMGEHEPNRIAHDVRQALNKGTDDVG